MLTTIVAVVAVLLVLTRGQDTYVARPPSSTEPSGAAEDVAPGLAAAALTRFADALRAGDPEAAARLAPADDPAAARRLAGIAANARDLSLTDLDIRYVDQSTAPDVEGRWRAVADVRWRIAGFDPTPAQAEVSFVLQSDASGVGIVSAGGGGDRSPLWLSGPLTVRRAGDALVQVAVSARADRYARLARVAIASVARTLDMPQSRLVVEVPATEPQLDRMLDASSGTYAGIAAVTAPVDGSDAADAPVHVFVNPEQFDQLRRAGAQVVMTHETTHAATGAVTSRAPLWLVEGFADYVALRNVALPITTTAAELIARTRRSGVPRALPSTADFSVQASGLDATYESAWIACVIIGERVGTVGLERLYDRAGAGAPFAATLRQVTGLTLAQLTSAWRERLSDLAS